MATVEVRIIRFRADSSAKLVALSRSDAVIEVKPNGSIWSISQNFLEGFDGTFDGIQGRNHSLPGEPDVRLSFAYHEVSDALSRGEHRCGEFPWFTESGRTVGIKEIYNPA